MTSLSAAGWGAAKAQLSVSGGGRLVLNPPSYVRWQVSTLH